MAAPVELLRRVPLFEDLSNREVERLARSFKERKLSAGDEIATEGQSGVGFFVIGEGEVAYFGEVALIDDGPRTATVKAVTDVTAYGLTPWDFRPLVEDNASIAWELLQAMAKRLRM